LIERLWYYGGWGLVPAVVTWIGFAAFFIGLKRFGLKVRVPSWLLFLALWGIIALIGVVGGIRASNMISHITVPILVLGLVVYLASLLISRKKVSK